MIDGTVGVSTPSDREVQLTRAFDAPRELVFDALTQPALLRRWSGPTGWSLLVCNVNLRVGGAWRFVVQRPGGKAIGQFGVYVEIARPARLVNTESWEDWDAGETLVTTTLVERGGRTMLTSTVLFPSRQVRDTVLESGFDSGVQEHYDRLAVLLRSGGTSAEASPDRGA